MTDQRRWLGRLRFIIAAEMLSTAIHYTHNFVQIGDYPGPHGAMDTITRVGILLSWPVLTTVAWLGYRHYAQGRLAQARACLLTYSVLGFFTLGHFAYGVPDIPPVFLATVFTDALSAAAVAWFALRVIPRRAGPQVTAPVS